MTGSETLIAAISQHVLGTQRWKDPSEMSLARRIFLQTGQAPYGLSVSSRNMVRVHEVAITLHIALAELSARSEPGNVAIASMLSDNELVLFVASDENKDLDLAGQHLRKLWSGLREISQASSIDDPEQRRPEKSRAAREFRRYVYEYSWNKQMQRCDSYMDPDLLGFLESSLDQSTPEMQNQFSDLNASQVEVYRHFRDISRFVKGCKDGSSTYSDVIDGFLSSTAHLFNLHKGLNEDTRAGLNRHCLGIIHQTLRPSLTTCIERMLSTERTVRELLRLSSSRHLRAILQRDIDVVPVTVQPVLLTFNLIDNPELRKIVRATYLPVHVFEDIWKKAASTGNGIWKFEKTVHPHCESALLACLAESKPQLVKEANIYGFIGTSDLSCAGCRMYFSTYNDIAESAGLPKFHLPGFHDRPYHPWAKPKTSEGEFSDALEARLCSHARFHLGNDIRMTT